MKTTHSISAILFGALATLGATLLTGLVLALPLVSQAAMGDLTDCNQTGAYAMSVGSLNAVGGTFVPVSDKAVTLNTGYIVYKECVLRRLINDMRKQITFAYVNAEMKQFTEGNNGNPYFPQYFGQEQFQAGDKARKAALSTITGALNPAFQNQVATALERSYAQTTQAPQMSLSCPPTVGFWDGVFALGNPTCDPVFAYGLAQNQLDANFAAGQDAWRTQLNWGRGIYSITDSTGKVLTPGILVGTIAAQALTSGFRQQENANDIGQIIGQVFSGVGNRILNAGLGGLASIGTSVAGQPSYLAQGIKETSTGLASTITSFLLSTLVPALTVENSYNLVQKAMAADLTKAYSQLQDAENTCWGLIISKVCDASSATSTIAGGTCTASDGSGTLNIATSMQFSDPIATAQIKPIALIVQQNASTSDQALKIIGDVILNAQNPSNPTAQKDAFSKWDALTSANPPVLHNQTDLDRVQGQATDLNTALFGQSSPLGLLPNTFKIWTGDGTDTYGSPVSGAVAWDGTSSTGWCNASTQSLGGPATIAKWIQKWGTP